MEFKQEYYNKLYTACKNTFEELFNNNKETFYYCTLTITGDGLTPVISAWSYEALDRQCNGNQDEIHDIKWSYADSPYYAFGYEKFEEVTQLLAERREILKTTKIDWECEVEMYLDVMQNTMEMLDNEGVFSVNQKRNEVLVATEIMPPDGSCTIRVKKLNNNGTAIFQEWLQEIAE